MEREPCCPKPLSTHGTHNSLCRILSLHFLLAGLYKNALVIGRQLMPLHGDVLLDASDW